MIIVITWSRTLPLREQEDSCGLIKVTEFFQIGMEELYLRSTIFTEKLELIVGFVNSSE